MLLLWGEPCEPWPLAQGMRQLHIKMCDGTVKHFLEVTFLFRIFLNFDHDKSTPSSKFCEILVRQYACKKIMNKEPK